MVMSTQTNVETQQSKQRKYHHNNKSYDNILEMKASTRNNGTDFFFYFPSRNAGLWHDDTAGNNTIRQTITAI